MHDISEWMKRYRAIGRAEGYTKEQIEEYGEYLKLMATTATNLRAKSNKKG